MQHKSGIRDKFGHWALGIGHWLTKFGGLSKELLSSSPFCVGVKSPGVAPLGETPRPHSSSLQNVIANCELRIALFVALASLLPRGDATRTSVIANCFNSPCPLVFTASFFAKNRLLDKGNHTKRLSCLW
jgi:hypothetical protein